jgi:hypothetical protein
MSEGERLLRNLRQAQGLRVANASRGARTRELERYELIDAAIDRIVWTEAMRQQCLRL